MRASDVLVVLMLLSAACKAKEQAKPLPPASVEKRAESDLPRVLLAPKAEERLGLAFGVATAHPSARTRTVAGEVVPSSGRSLAVVAPIAGRVASARADLRPGQAVKRGEAILRLTPVAAVDRDLRATANRSVAMAEAKLAALESRVTRTERLLADGAGSVRAVEEARSERDSAKAEVDAAKLRVGMLEKAPLEADVAVTLKAPEEGILQRIGATDGTLVSAGTPLFDLVGTGALWVKVTLFVGDARSVSAESAIRVRPLTSAPSESDVDALPIAGPPTADPATASLDFYYALPKNAEFRPGERISATLDYREQEPAVHVPREAIVRDARGAAWVYVPTGEHAYERRRVEVERVDEEEAKLTRGLVAGTKVVTSGASEVFGVEMGNGK